MEQIFALIKNQIIENTIVADEGFAAQIAGSWDHVIRIDEMEPRPGIGWAYDGETFTAPIVEEPPPEEP